MLFAGTRATDALHIRLARMWDVQEPNFPGRKMKSLAILLFLSFALFMGFVIHALLAFFDVTIIFYAAYLIIPESGTQPLLEAQEPVTAVYGAG